MSKKTTLDPSIATILDIDPVGHEERVEIKFTASENWTGDFEFVVYDCAFKNSFVKPAGALVKADNLMTMIIEPSVQGLAVGSRYFEIFSLTAKRVLFKGLLNIIK
jgi:hypothetical protein